MSLQSKQKNLEDEVRKIHDLFLYLNEQIESQQPSLQNIEELIINERNVVKEAEIELTEAESLQNTFRKRILITNSSIGGITGAVLSTIIAPISLSTGLIGITIGSVGGAIYTLFRTSNV